MNKERTIRELTKIKCFILMIHNDISNPEGSLNDEHMLNVLEMCIDYIGFIQDDL